MRFRRGAAILVACMGLAAIGCGGDDDKAVGASGGSASKGGGTVTVGVALDQTGAVGFAGVMARKGIELAVEEANANDALGNGTKIELVIEDPATDPKQAANIATKFVRDEKVSVLLAGPGSPTALAVAPIAQRGKLPTNVIEAGVPGVVEAGDYIYRASAPQNTYHNLMAEYLKGKGVKTIMQVFTNDIPTNNSLATETWPALAKEYGFELIGDEPVSGTATNFGTAASKIVSKKPDAVMLHLSGAQYVSFLAAVKRAGYDGILAGGPGASSGVLKPAGKNAEGFVFLAAYSPSTTDPNGAKFAEEYRKKTGEDPTLYSASGYDNMNFLIETLKQANGDYSREAVHEAMKKVAEAGLPDAAMGAITFENRDARIRGHLVQWTGGKEQVIEP